MSDDQQIIKLARQVITAEAEALSLLADNLDESFTKAVGLISGMDRVGRVVFSGMGKAGFIAMKISGTLASIGVPSYFLHPAEAVHGDLGRYTDADIAVLLSNSGETEEITELIPFLRRVGCPVIAISSNPESTLGRSADVTLKLINTAEAGPLGLAPTTSTTMMLALGDALAMALLEVKGLTEKDFAGLHPAGSLGRSLLTAADIMRKGQAMCVVNENTNCRDVLHQITNTRGRPGAAIIIDNNWKLSGIFTDGDLRRCLDKGSSFLDDPVSMFMGKSPKSITPDTLVKEATAIMNRSKIDQIIVVDGENRPVGLIDIQDAVSVKLK
jgi:arabinose-5-phosphate isomerase